MNVYRIVVIGEEEKRSPKNSNIVGTSCPVYSYKCEIVLSFPIISSKYLRIIAAIASHILFTPQQCNSNKFACIVFGFYVYSQ